MGFELGSKPWWERVVNFRVFPLSGVQVAPIMRIRPKVSRSQINLPNPPERIYHWASNAPQGNGTKATDYNYSVTDLWVYFS